METDTTVRILEILRGADAKMDARQSVGALVKRKELFTNMTGDETARVLAWAENALERFGMQAIPYVAFIIRLTNIGLGCSDDHDGILNSLEGIVT